MKRDDAFIEDPDVSLTVDVAGRRLVYEGSDIEHIFLDTGP